MFLLRDFLHFHADFVVQTWLFWIPWLSLLKGWNMQLFPDATSRRMNFPLRHKKRGDIPAEREKIPPTPPSNPKKGFTCTQRIFYTLCSTLTGTLWRLGETCSDGGNIYVFVCGRQCLEATSWLKKMMRGTLKVMKSPPPQSGAEKIYKSQWFLLDWLGVTWHSKQLFLSSELAHIVPTTHDQRLTSHGSHFTP